MFFEMNEMPTCAVLPSGESSDAKGRIRGGNKFMIAQVGPDNGVFGLEGSERDTFSLITHVIGPLSIYSGPHNNMSIQKDHVHAPALPRR